jgi:hypothetical protein
MVKRRGYKEMKKAKEYRIRLKNLRVNAEKTRKDLKEESLRKGKAIDGVANIIKYLIEPIENYLEDQEKFAEKLEKQQKLDLKNKRVNELLDFCDVSTDYEIYKLDEMPEDVYISFFENKKKSYYEIIEANKKAEIERIEKERIEKEKQEEIKKENAKLKAEAEQRELELKKERELQAKKEAELNAKLKAEAEQREFLENEKQEKEEKERVEKLKIEQERLKNIENENKKGEKEKYIDFCNLLDNLQLPVVNSKNGILLNESIKSYIEKLIIKIKENI